MSNKGQERSVIGNNCGVLPLAFPNLERLPCCSSLNDKFFFEFLVYNEVFHFSKRQLHAGTARTK